MELEEDNNAENNDMIVEDVVPGYDSFDTFSQKAFETIIKGIKASNSLPIGDNFDYYKCFPEFVKATKAGNKKLSNAMQNVLQVTEVPGSMHNASMDERFELLVHANDVLLDRAEECMNAECKTSQLPEKLVVTQTNYKRKTPSWNINPLGNAAETTDNVNQVRLLTAKNISRPQILFKDAIDNSEKPWEPRIKEKPNSLKPLAIQLDLETECYTHPYEFELDRFEPPSEQLKKVQPILYKPLEETQLIMIDNKEDLNILMEDLKKYNEIAIDLEHHSYRSYQGFTCLMQISTRDTDYIIDTLLLRSELHILNEYFTKPSILKVMHGADNDIIWLQRDLSLYIVNLFDTHQAAKQLNLPKLGLAALVKGYCNIDLNKKYQFYDWRIRPLLEELIAYAREDTHYLLYIKDIMTNKLIDMANGQTNILKAVFDRSTDICKLLYLKPVWTEESYKRLARDKGFDNRQMYALRALHKWRDVTARQIDDSTEYVLQNHMLIEIARVLPREMQGILACCSTIPPLVKQNLLELHRIILAARQQPLVKPVLEEDIRQRMIQKNPSTNQELRLYAPHDIPADTEPRADLPCLLDQKVDIPNVDKFTASKHTVTIFDHLEKDNELMKNGQKKPVFVSPYQIYRQELIRIAAEEAQKRERGQKQEEERLQQLKLEEEQQTAESVERVHDHFKKTVSQMKSKPEPVPLGKMQGTRKRRREISDNKNEAMETPDMTNPRPSLNTTITIGFKKQNIDTEDSDIEEIPLEKSKSTNHNSQSPWRQNKNKNKKGDKFRGNQQASTSNHFDYKSFDFSKFSGGSRNSDKPPVRFQQKVNKEKKKRKKKDKLNI